MKLEGYAKWYKLDTKGPVLYDSIWESTIWNTESSQVYVERKQKGGCHGLRGKGNGVSI